MEFSLIFFNHLSFNYMNAARVYSIRAMQEHILACFFSLSTRHGASMNYFWGSSSTEKSKSESPEPVVQSTNKKLRCRIGPNSDCLTTYNVNDESVPHFVNSSEFVGQIVVRVKDFNGITSDGSPPISSLSYFNEKKRQFSIQLSGRFKKVNITSF